MDYEQKYKEALERARQFGERSLLEDSSNIVEYIFPELKESEDERIRKALISFFQRFPYDSIESAGTNAKEVLTWLEKQGEQNSWKESWIKLLEDANTEYQMSMNEGMTKDAVKLAIKGLEELHLWDIIKEYIEKQGEQKPDETFIIEHGKYYYCVKDYFSGGNKRVSKGNVVQALRGMGMMTLNSEEAAKYFLPINAVIEQKSTKWSKEDEEMLDNIIDDYDEHDDLVDDIGKIMWLKSLKSQPKQEWSEKNVVLKTKVIEDWDGDGINSPIERWLTLEDTEIPFIPDSLGLKDGDKVKLIIIKED